MCVREVVSIKSVNKKEVTVGFMVFCYVVHSQKSFVRKITFLRWP